MGALLLWEVVLSRSVVVQTQASCDVQVARQGKARQRAGRALLAHLLPIVPSCDSCLSASLPGPPQYQHVHEHASVFCMTIS